MDEGFDGMVHVKPFGCMPEVTAMSALQRISRERTFPILFMSYDVQTSEHGRSHAARGVLRHARDAAEGDQSMRSGYLGVDIGSISTKAVVIGDDGEVYASAYLWTEGNPIGAVRRVLTELAEQLEGARRRQSCRSARPARRASSSARCSRRRW